MAYTYFVNAELKTGFIYLTGYVDADQVVTAGDALYKSHAWQADYNSLWDFRSSREVDITENGFDKIVRQKLNRDAETASHEKIALLINRDTLISAATLIQIKADSTARKIRAFSREKEARTWLGLPEEANIWGWLETHR